MTYIYFVILWNFLLLMAITKRKFVVLYFYLCSSFMYTSMILFSLVYSQCNASDCCWKSELLLRILYRNSGENGK